uniref:ParB domain-containing protein n=1 Tax=Steinernema glaseri TaxID=37863 RepID=A0A1I8AS48_9BILA
MNDTPTVISSLDEKPLLRDLLVPVGYLKPNPFIRKVNMARVRHLMNLYSSKQYVPEIECSVMLPAKCDPTAVIEMLDSKKWEELEACGTLLEVIDGNHRVTAAQMASADSRPTTARCTVYPHLTGEKISCQSIVDTIKSETRLPVGLVHKMIAVRAIITKLNKKEESDMLKCLSRQGFSLTMIDVTTRHFSRRRLERLRPLMDAFEHNACSNEETHKKLMEGGTNHTKIFPLYTERSFKMLANTFGTKDVQRPEVERTTENLEKGDHYLDLWCEKIQEHESLTQEVFRKQMNKHKSAVCIWDWLKEGAPMKGSLPDWEVLGTDYNPVRVHKRKAPANTTQERKRTKRSTHTYKLRTKGVRPEVISPLETSQSSTHVIKFQEDNGVSVSFRSSRSSTVEAEEEERLEEDRVPEEAEEAQEEVPTLPQGSQFDEADEDCLSDGSGMDAANTSPFYGAVELKAPDQANKCSVEDPVPKEAEKGPVPKEAKEAQEEVPTLPQGSQFDEADEDCLSDGADMDAANTSPFYGAVELKAPDQANKCSVEEFIRNIYKHLEEHGQTSVFIRKSNPEP